MPDCSAQLFVSRILGRSASGSLALLLTIMGLMAFPQTVLARPLSVSPAPLRFGAQPIGVMSPAESVTVRNPNNTAVTVSNISVTGNFQIADNTCGDAIEAGADCSIAIAFLPACPVGAQTGSLLISSSISASPQKVLLSGMGVANTTSKSNQVLIAGGVGNRAVLLDSAELFDPSTCTFAMTGRMTMPRGFHTATFLDPAVVRGCDAGKVLITGGQIDSKGTITNSAELYDPASGTFSATGWMNVARAEHTATLIPSGPLAGKVVIIGGEANGVATNTAEIYDPRTRAFSLTSGTMNIPRSEHTATLISCEQCDQNGYILITGGYEKDDGVRGDGIPNATAELFNPSTQAFTCVGGEGSALPCADVMSSPRWEHEAESLVNGDVLIMGGANRDNFFLPGTSTNTTDIYDPVSGIMTPGPLMRTGRNALATAVLANGPFDGQVLITGGFNTSGRATLATAELFDPAGNKMTCIGGQLGPRCRGSMANSRASHEATLLGQGPSAGEVLLTGGISFHARRVLNSAEVFDPLLGRFLRLNNMKAARNEHTVTQLESSYTPED